MKWLIDWFSNKSEDDTNESTNEITPSSGKQTSKKSFKTLLSESIDELMRVATKYHTANDVSLTSDWASEYNKKFKFEIKIFSGALGYELRCYTFNKNDDVKYIFKAQTRKPLDINETIENTPAVHDDIILHIQSIIGQVNASIAIAYSEMEELISVKRNIRLWYVDADDALASYPKYKDKFKKFKGKDRYEKYNGRFIFKSDTAGIEEIMEQFPDVDLAEIYDTKTETYEVFNVSAAQDVLVF